MQISDLQESVSQVIAFAPQVQILYGYTKDPADPKRHWIVDEEAAGVVKQIFAWCMEGYGPSQIARKLRDAKVECPAAHCRTLGICTPT